MDKPTYVPIAPFEIESLPVSCSVCGCWVLNTGGHDRFHADLVTRSQIASDVKTS
jgi:hypothetical protein